jgi:hypothetical protein
MEDLITKQASEEKEVAAKMDKYNAPALTNFIDAVAKSEKIDIDTVSEAMSTTFATKNIKNQKTVGALESAAAAGIDISNISARGKGQEDALKQGLAGKLNTVLKGMKEEAIYNGSNLQNVIEGNLTDEDIKAGAKVAKSLGSSVTAKEADAMREDLESQEADLQKKGKHLEGYDAERLKGFRALKKSTALESDSALNAARPGTVQSFAAATFEGQRSIKAKAAANELKAGYVQSMGEQLEQISTETAKGGGLTENAKVVKDLLSSEEYSKYAITDTKTGQRKLSKEGYAKVLEDFQGNGGKGRGKYFGNEEKRKEFEQSSIGQKLQDTQDKINSAEASVTAKGKTPEDTTQKDLLDALKILTSTISGENGISSAIRNLSTSLLGL